MYLKPTSRANLHFLPFVSTVWAIFGINILFEALCDDSYAAVGFPLGCDQGVIEKLELK